MTGSRDSLMFFWISLDFLFGKFVASNLFIPRTQFLESRFVEWFLLGDEFCEEWLVATTEFANVRGVFLKRMRIRWKKSREIPFFRRNPYKFYVILRCEVIFVVSES